MAAVLWPHGTCSWRCADAEEEQPVCCNPSRLWARTAQMLAALQWSWQARGATDISPHQNGAAYDTGLSHQASAAAVACVGSMDGRPAQL